MIIQARYRIESHVCSDRVASPLCLLLAQGCSTTAIELTAPLERRMKIRIVPHDPQYREAVEAFNRRLQEGGSRWGFYTHHECDWIPRSEGANVWRDFYLAVAENGMVHGGFALKPQPWYIRGSDHTVADWQGPFSEGEISPQYAALGLRMVRDMQKKEPLLYSWGHGGRDVPILQLIRKMGWFVHGSPLMLYISNPFRFLRKNGALRRSTGLRLLLDLSAFSGLGPLALHALMSVQLTLSRYRHSLRAGAQPVASEFDRFEAWADELWNRCKSRYEALAVRDAGIMNTLLPDGQWPNAIKLKVEQEGKVIGWVAVMDTAMKEDHRFGDLRLGSVIDCLAAPEHCFAVIIAAKKYLCDRGVDLIVSNQTHPAWIEGFEGNGFLRIPNMRFMACSPALSDALSPHDTALKGLHLTNLDGHGPHMM